MLMMAVLSLESHGGSPTSFEHYVCSRSRSQYLFFQCRVSFNVENRVRVLGFRVQSKECFMTEVIVQTGRIKLQKYVPVVFSFNMKCITMHRSLEGRTLSPDTPTSRDCHPTSEGRSLLALSSLFLMQVWSQHHPIQEGFLLKSKQRGTKKVQKSTFRFLSISLTKGKPD